MGMSKEREIMAHPNTDRQCDEGRNEECWNCGANGKGWCDDEAYCKHCGEFQAY